jgi:hypothetical protein
MNLPKIGTRLLIIAPIGLPLLCLYFSYMTTGAFPPLPVMLGLVLFPAWWCFVSWIFSYSSGWQRLAALYPARTSPTGQRFSTDARIGIARYGGIYVDVSPDGLFLSVMFAFRIGHQPLFIPWTEIHNRQPKTWPFWREGVEFDIGAPCVVSMWLPKKIFKSQYAAA